MGFVYTADSVKIVPNFAKRSNTSAKTLLGVAIENTQTERNLVWGFLIAIYIHKKTIE